MTSRWRVRFYESVSHDVEVKTAFGLDFPGTRSEGSAARGAGPVVRGGPVLRVLHPVSILHRHPGSELPEAPDAAAATLRVTCRASPREIVQFPIRFVCLTEEETSRSCRRKVKNKGRIQGLGCGPGSSSTSRIESTSTFAQQKETSHCECFQGPTLGSILFEPQSADRLVIQTNPQF